MTNLGKILIVRFSSIGDIVLASPLIRCLRTTFPTSQIDFVVKSGFAELVRYNPYLSAVHELKNAEHEELRLLKKRIHNERYDLILDIHNGNRSRYLRLFSGARHVRIVNKRVIARFMLVNFKQHWYAEAIPSVSERYLETTSSFGVQNDGKGLEVFVPDDVRNAVAVMMNRYHLDTYPRVVGLVPAAKHATKRWLPERFVELGIAMTTREDTKLLVFGGNEDSEYCGDIVQMINSRVGWSAAESFAGKFSLLETASVFDACHAVVTNDTGLMHLAAARRRKVVGIFGSTVREFGFFPYGTEYLVVERQALPCRPCSHIGLPECPRQHFRCMKDISCADVLHAVESILKKQPLKETMRNV